MHENLAARKYIGGLRLQYRPTVNVDIFACINFCGFMKLAISRVLKFPFLVQMAL